MRHSQARTETCSIAYSSSKVSLVFNGGFLYFVFIISTIEFLHKLMQLIFSNRKNTHKSVYLKVAVEAMAYVPPHRRIREGSSSSPTPTPVAPPPQQDQEENDQIYLWDWFAVYGIGDTSNLLLEFKRFNGETYEHLRRRNLYTLSANYPPVNEGLEVENNLLSSAMNEAFPWKKICERFKDDIRKGFHNIQSYTEKNKESKPYHVQPYLLFRLGKILFHDCGLTRQEIITTDMLEKAMEDETRLRNPVWTSFNLNVQKKNLEALQDKILAGLQTSDFKYKENYLIQVADYLSPGDGSILYLICANNGGQLQLEKIRMSFLYGKHFMADISCVNKLMDLRLLLATKKYLTEVSEEERESMEGIVKSACIEKGVKGGLHWPFGGDSVGNRFKVEGTWHRKVTSIVGKLWTIQLKHVNRANYMGKPGYTRKANRKISSEEEVTHEVDLKLTSLTKYMKDQVQWDEENIMNTLEETLEWLWTECL